MPAPDTLLGAAAAVLKFGETKEKVAAAQFAAELAKLGAPIGDPATVYAPTFPSRPLKPLLLPATQVPKRRLGSPSGRAALLHAIAHIEFNAIDLAFDLAVRFALEINNRGLNLNSFVLDWVGIGAEEAKHFNMIQQRLAEMGKKYGDFDAHNGLWEAASITSDNLAARLAVAPLILEARGLDVTPGMVNRLLAAGDKQSATILEEIYIDEIGHVACGKRWFHEICIANGEEPAKAFLELRRRYYKGALKPPFNHKARAKAGLSRDFYEPK